MIISKYFLPNYGPKLIKIFLPNLEKVQSFKSLRMYRVERRQIYVLKKKKEANLCIIKKKKKGQIYVYPAHKELKKTMTTIYNKMTIKIWIILKNKNNFIFNSTFFPTNIISFHKIQ